MGFICFLAPFFAGELTSWLSSNGMSSQNLSPDAGTKSFDHKNGAALRWDMPQRTLPTHTLSKRVYN